MGDFPIILKPEDFVGKKVHVDGWPIGCVFVLQSTSEGQHVLMTPKTKRIFKTSNKLRMLRDKSLKLKQFYKGN